MMSTMEKYREFVVTSFLKRVQPIAIASAYGAVVRDESGREYVDCFSGISVVNAGHCNPVVLEAAKAQMDKLVHCSSYVYHAGPTADLAEKLAQITPGKLKKSFFGSSGAEAIEGALRLAKVHTGKHEFIALQGGFHGRTLGALSVTGSSGRKRRGGPYASGVAFAPAPYIFRSSFDTSEKCVEECVRAFEQTLKLSTSGDVAAFVAEPIMGEGGIIVPPSSYFRAVKEILDQHKILFIVDEVQSGFARTGAMFAIEHYGVEPDIIVTAKGIANGFPLSAFTTTDEIAASFRPGDHLSTFGGNPVCCAAALANINFIEQENLCAKAKEDGGFIIERIKSMCGALSILGEVRGAGLMIGLELIRDQRLTPAPAMAEAVQAACLEKGLLVGVGGVYGNVIRIQPPLTINREQIEFALAALGDCLASVGNHPPA
jgi:4-aminobutyrate aminotransferase / (S)-3-amino-2-methylpropionate transaminase / 5-aminovalerate transaminase